MRFIKLLILTVTLMSTATTLASERFYVGGSLGPSSFEEDFDGLDVETDGTAIRLLIGWHLHEQFSLEFGYQDLGDLKDDIVIDGESVRVRLSADGFTLGAAGSLPVTDSVALTGRVGAFFWDGDADINNFTVASPDDRNLYLSVGARYRVSERFALTADVTRYELDDAEADVLAIGLAYRF